MTNERVPLALARPDHPRPRTWSARLGALCVQLISFAALLAVVNLVALPLSTTAAQASVSGAMDSYFDDMGAAACLFRRSRPPIPG